MNILEDDIDFTKGIMLIDIPYRKKAKAFYNSIKDDPKARARIGSKVSIGQMQYVFTIWGMPRPLYKARIILNQYNFNCRYHAEIKCFVVYRYYDELHPNPDWSGKETEQELKRFIQDYGISSEPDFYYD